ncbi:MAG TPA: FAD-dependent oxidoreductase [Chloroflexota bacterium]|nr:FAD-dependent oxidoreductase [Chloroflexota bacterium]
MSTSSSSGPPGEEHQPDAPQDQDGAQQQGQGQDSEKSGGHRAPAVLTATRPFWIDPTESAYPSLEGDASVEVAVVGGGISGVGAARWLLEAGVESVALLERRTVCSGASGRNAGFVMAVAPENFPLTDDPVEHAEAAAVWEFTAINQQLVADTIADLELACDYRRRGSLGLAAYPEEWERMVLTAEIAQDNGLGVMLVDRADLPGEWLREDYYGGAWFPGNGELNPGAFVRGLAAHLHRQGACIWEHTDVLEIEEDGEGYRLRTPAGSVSAGSLVLATNAYTREILPSAELVIFPVRGQVLATSPVEECIVECPVYANDGFQYWRQTVNGSIVVGGWRDMDAQTEVGTVEELNFAIQTRLEQVARRMSAPRKIRIANRWAGIMGFTPDRRPLVGYVPGCENAVLCAGFSGHGMAMAYHSAREAVSMLLQQGSPYAALFDPARFDAG